MTLDYNLPGLHNGLMPLRAVSNGWTVSADTILQSGTPFTVYTSAAFAPVCSSGKPSHNVCPAGTTVVGNTGGDYNADGDNNDYPNLPGFRYTIPTSRSADLHGVFAAADFAAPAFGTEGNEQPNR
jgi:hypothetical protein